MSDFLLGLRHTPKRLFCTSQHVKYTYIHLRPVLRSQFNIPRVSSRYLAELALTTAVSLNGPTTLVINSVNQPRVSQFGYERVHMNGALFSASDQSQTWTSLQTCRQKGRAAHFTKEEQTILDKYEEVKHLIQG